MLVGVEAHYRDVMFTADECNQRGHEYILVVAGFEHLQQLWNCLAPAAAKRAQGSNGMDMLRSSSRIFQDGKKLLDDWGSLLVVEPAQFAARLLADFFVGIEQERNGR